jgi:hypothetical protein
VRASVLVLGVFFNVVVLGCFSKEFGLVWGSLVGLVVFVCLFVYVRLLDICCCFDVFVFVCLSKVSYKVLVGLSMLL